LSRSHMSGSSSTIKIFTRASELTPILTSVTSFALVNVEWPVGAENQASKMP